MVGDPGKPRAVKVFAAWDIAEEMLGQTLPRRWRHSQGVWSRSLMVGGSLAAADGELLEQAAVLHDVGYAPGVALTGFHPLDGARHLRSIGMDERVVSLVAHHSCAHIEADQRGLGAFLGEFKRGPQVLTDCLIFCDMTTSPDGLRVTVDERLTEILARYGPDSVVARSIVLAEPELRAAASRVASRLGASDEEGATRCMG
jgi:hypothetical protein